MVDLRARERFSAGAERHRGRCGSITETPTSEEAAVVLDAGRWPRVQLKGRLGMATSGGSTGAVVERRIALLVRTYLK